MAPPSAPGGGSSGGPARRLPLPASLPPYDDEVGLGPPRQARRRGPERSGGPTQGALALAITTNHGAAPKPEPPRRLRLVGSGASAAGRTPAGPGPAPPALPDPRRWAAQLVQAAMESIDGKRPIQQLTRWTDEAVYRELARRADRNRTRFVVRPRVRAVRCCPAGPTATEASVVVQFGARVRAVAVRFEAAGGRWLCTAFELIEPRRSGPRRR